MRNNKVCRKTGIMKIFKFPVGTTKIDKKELKEVFSKYELVEIPGTVFRIDARFDNNDSSRFAVKELVLNEGTQSLILFANNTHSVNVPKSLLEIETNAQLPRVLCLPENFIRLNWGIYGVEYLQAYGESEVRYCFGRGSKVRHYVLLGKKLTPKKYLFDNIPAGCVIHVESEKMAKSVLKKGGFDVSKVFVVPDALEWKDFPADKLALTMEEYNPESRITSAQTTLIEKKFEEQTRKAEEFAEQERERNKGKIMGVMLHPMVENYMSGKGLEYKVSKIVKKGELAILFQLAEDLYILSGIKQESPEESLGGIVEAVQKFRDLYSRYEENIAALFIWIRKSCGFNNDDPYMSIPLAENVYVTGKMRMASLTTDATTIMTFAQELKLILDDSTKKGIRFEFSNQDRLWR